MLSPDFGTNLGTSRQRVKICKRQPLDRVIIRDRGELAEWSKAPDSKSGLGQPNGGSNPSLSATSSLIGHSCFFCKMAFSSAISRVGGLAETRNCAGRRLKYGA